MWWNERERNKSLFALGSADIQKGYWPFLLEKKLKAGGAFETTEEYLRELLID